MKELVKPTKLEKQLQSTELYDECDSNDCGTNSGSCTTNDCEENSKSCGSNSCYSNNGMGIDDIIF